jgi:hypothetical protein
MTKAERMEWEELVYRLEAKIEEACEVALRYKSELEELSECLDEVYALNQDPEIDGLIERYISTPSKGQMQ